MVWVDSSNQTFSSMPCCLDLIGPKSRQMQNRRDRWEGRKEGTEEANERRYSKQKTFLREYKGMTLS